LSATLEESVRNGRLIWGLFAALAALLVLLPGGGAEAQDGGASMRVVAPAEEIDSSEDEVAIEVVADNVDNLAGFQFVMSFDEDVLEFKRLENGLFITSTGRDLQCGEITLQGGALRYTCVTLRLEPEGPDGSGTLVTLYFDPKDGGTTKLGLSNTKLVTPAAEEMQMTTQDAELKVKGDSGLNVVLIALIAGGAVAAIAVVGGGAFLLRGRGGSASS
jgi:hypothetical protein